MFDFSVEICVRDDIKLPCGVSRVVVFEQVTAGSAIEACQRGFDVFSAKAQIAPALRQELVARGLRVEDYHAAAAVKNGTWCAVEN